MREETALRTASELHSIISSSRCLSNPEPIATGLRLPRRTIYTNRKSRPGGPRFHLDLQEMDDAARHSSPTPSFADEIFVQFGRTPAHVPEINVLQSLSVHGKQTLVASLMWIGWHEWGCFIKELREYGRLEIVIHNSRAEVACGIRRCDRKER